MRKNYFSVMLFQLLTVIAPLVSMPYIARKLGPEMIGRDAFVGSIVQIFLVVVILSVDTYGKKQIAQSENANDVFLEVYSIQLFNTLIVMLVYFLFIFVYQRYTSLFLFYSITLFSTGIDCAWYFIGKEQISRVMYRNIFIKLLNLLAIFLFIKGSGDLWLYILLNGCSLLIGQVVIIKELLNDVGKFRLTTNNWKSHFPFILTLFIVPSMGLIYTSVNKILLAFFVSEIEMGYYNQAYKLYVMIVGFMTAFSSILIPRIALHFIKKEHNHVKRYIDLSIQLVLLITLPFIVGVFLCGKEFIELFLGESFSATYQVLIIFAPCFLVKCLVDILGVQYLVIANRQKEYAASVVLGAIMSVSTCYLFLSMGLGFRAPAVALLIGNVCTLLSELYVTRRVYSIRYLCKMFLKYGSISLFMGTFIYLLGTQLTEYTTLKAFSIKVSLGLVIYVGTLLLIGDSSIKVLFKKDEKNEKQPIKKNREPYC